MSFGQGILLANFDVKSAYRNISVHPEDRYLLGIKWQGNYYIDMVLPFGLRYAPFIFSSVADLLEWILRHNYGLNFLLHYLDDFWTLGPSNSPARQNNLDTCIRLFKDWHIPLHPDNMEGPSTCLTVLGIELDFLSPSKHVLHVTNLSALLPYWNLGLLNVIVQGRSWNLLLAPSIMRAKSFPRGVLLYGG